MQGEVNSLSAPPCASKELSSKAKVHQSRLARALGANHSGNDALVPTDATKDLFEHLSVHVKCATVDELEAVSSMHLVQGTLLELTVWFWQPPVMALSAVLARRDQTSPEVLVRE